MFLGRDELVHNVKGEMDTNPFFLFLLFLPGLFMSFFFFFSPPLYFSLAC